MVPIPQFPELVDRFQIAASDHRRYIETPMVVREGQGTFRVRILDAYGRRCAVTGESSEPVLGAAHIQLYLGPASNHVQNGIALRADIHRLFDGGYGDHHTGLSVSGECATESGI